MGSIWRTGVLRVDVRVCVLLVCLSWLGVGANAQSAKERSGLEAQSVRALFVSDIHFEPFWDPEKAAKLAAAPEAEWRTILAAPDSPGRAARFAELQEACHAKGVDTSYALLRSSLRAMRANAAGAKFVIVSGDLMAHSFDCKYAAVLKSAAPDDYREFTEKTVEFVLGSLREALPGVPVYAALGNNDSDCGDYQLDAKGEFLAGLAGEFTRGSGRADREEAAKTFALGGYYSVTLPAPMQHTRLLVLDDLFMSRRYATCGGKEDTEPAAAQIAWLAQQLDEARRSHEKVWVMAHIPPGVDPYSTATKGKNVCKGNKPTMFLSSEALAETMAQFGDVIRLGIFAHTHMDEMRLLEPADSSAAEKGVAVKMVPSISPVDGNNPSFVVARIDAATATMKDYRVIAASNKTGIETTWAEEYDFAQTYKEPAFSAATVANLVEHFEADRNAETKASESYIHNYEVGQPLRALKLVWPMYVCALKNDEAAAFDNCVCGATP